MRRSALGKPWEKAVKAPERRDAAAGKAMRNRYRRCAVLALAAGLASPPACAEALEDSITDEDSVFHITLPSALITAGDGSADWDLNDIAPDAYGPPPPQDRRQDGPENTASITDSPPPATKPAMSRANTPAIAASSGRPAASAPNWRSCQPMSAHSRSPSCSSRPPPSTSRTRDGSARTPTTSASTS